MKSTCILAAITAATAFGVNAQKINASKVSQTIKPSFVKAYLRVTLVNDNEASIKNNRKGLSVVFDTKGIEQEVEAEIKKGGKTYYEAQVGSKDLDFDASGKAVSKI